MLERHQTILEIISDVLLNVMKYYSFPVQKN